MPEWRQEGRTFTAKEQLEITFDVLGLEGAERDQYRPRVAEMMALPMWRVRKILKKP